jgi:hypothetical protein
MRGNWEFGRELLIVEEALDWLDSVGAGLWKRTRDQKLGVCSPDSEKLSACRTQRFLDLISRARRGCPKVISMEKEGQKEERRPDDVLSNIFPVKKFSG